MVKYLGISNACDRDEGGPVVVNIDDELAVVGIVTKIVEGCVSFTSVGMAKISAYYDWLSRVAGNQPGRP